MGACGCLPALARFGQDLVQQILWDGQQDRTGATLHRRCQGALQQRNNLCRLMRLRRPLHEGREGRDYVHLLKGVAAPRLSAHLADDRHDRRRIDLRSLQPDSQVRCSGGTPRETERRTSRELGHRLRHEGGRTLVASRDDADAVGGQTIDDAQDAFARNGEGDLDSGPSQRCGQG